MSQVVSTRPSGFRFGVFQVDLRSGELRKSGVRVALQEQPFRVLVRLLEQPGDLVTREDLRRELWAADTFVDFEHGLNVAIKRLRDAVGDSADSPRFVETLPRRGYRFIAPVTLLVDGREAASQDAASPSAWQRPRIAWAVAAAIVLTGIGWGSTVLMRPQRPIAPSVRDGLLIADFVNTTNDGVFDGTLREALSGQLAQSPFFDLISRERVRSLLRQMTRALDEPVVDEIAREVCRRANGDISVNGRIAGIGTRYLLTIDAMACESGERLTTDTAEADREHVLDGLNRLALSLRERLGESQASRQRFNRPIREATTASFEALKAFTVAEDTRETRGDTEAAPFYERAVTLDKEFALAHARLGSVYDNTYRSAEAVAAVDRAYLLRDRVTERERFYIELKHCSLHFAQNPCGESVARLWKQTYPRDWGPYVHLCAYHAQWTSDYEQAIENGVEAVRLNPDTYFTYLKLADAYLIVNHFDDAKRVLDAARDRNIESGFLLEERFLVAFIRGDREAMGAAADAIHLRGSTVMPIAPVEAAAAAFEGRMKDARRLWSRDADAGSAEWRDSVRRTRLMTEAAVGTVEGGRSGRGDEPLRTLSVNRDLVIAALLENRYGEADRLLRGTGFLEKPVERRAPWFEIARVLLQVSRENRSAIDRLPARTQRDLRALAGYRLVYLRGLAYARAGDPAQAATEFQRIIDHRGIDPTSVLYPLAFVHQARAYAAMGESAKARNGYQQFLQMWKDADADLPVLQKAKAEYADLLTTGR